VQKPFRQWEAAVRARFSVEIAAVACVVPEHSISQQAIAEGARHFFPHLEGSSGLFANTGIERRYICEPPEWYFVSRGWEERTASFHRHALDLLEEATRRAADAAGIRIQEIAAIVTNTVTGLAVPSLEALLMHRLPFSRQVERLPIFGLGCGGGVGGIARAVRIAETMPGAYVLFLAVDLCSLCARGDDPSLANFVSIALFGDGAGAVLLRNTRGGPPPRRPRGRIVTIGEHCWPDTLKIMGWDVKENGFGVVLSPELPSLLRRELKPAIVAFLAREGIDIGDIAGMLLHPGGRRILDTAQEVLGLGREDLVHSWEILRQYGNMSSATALFILERALACGSHGRHLLAAFGPGFSAYFVVLDL
jgi:alkylresorcinol/alkylpyrone synthase